MTALNSEGPMAFFSASVDKWGAAEWFQRLSDAVKAHDAAIVSGDHLGAETYSRIISSSAFRLARDFGPEVAARLSALPPVDGLEVVMEKICHKEQIGIWANEITSALALSDFLREEWTFDDSVDLEREIAAQLLDIIKSAFTHPGLDLIASLSQASSVIAGLKAEVADLRDEWQAEYDARLAARRERITAERDALNAYGKLQIAESRISSLEEQNKRLREALNQSRLAFSGYVSPRSAIDMIDALGDHNG